MDRIILETGTKQTAARNLYTSCGYEITADYGVHKDLENSICMKKELP